MLGEVGTPRIRKLLVRWGKDGGVRDRVRVELQGWGASQSGVDVRRGLHGRPRCSSPACTTNPSPPVCRTSSGAVSCVELRKAAAMAGRPPGWQSTPRPCLAPHKSQRRLLRLLCLLLLNACSWSATASAMALFRRRWRSASSESPLQEEGQRSERRMRQLGPKGGHWTPASSAASTRAAPPQRRLPASKASQPASFSPQALERRKVDLPSAVYVAQFRLNRPMAPHHECSDGRAAGDGLHGRTGLRVPCQQCREEGPVGV